MRGEDLILSPQINNMYIYRSYFDYFKKLNPHIKYFIYELQEIKKNYYKEKYLYFRNKNEADTYYCHSMNTIYLCTLDGKVLIRKLNNNCRHIFNIPSRITPKYKSNIKISLKNPKYILLKSMSHLQVKPHQL
jgi:hypothetical protein